MPEILLPTYFAYLSHCYSVIHPEFPHHNVPLYMYYICKGHLWIYKWPKTGHLWFNNICTQVIKMLTFTQMNISVYHLMWCSVVTRISCVLDNTRFCKLCLVYPGLCTLLCCTLSCSLQSSTVYVIIIVIHTIYSLQPHKYSHTNTIT